MKRSCGHLSSFSMCGTYPRAQTSGQPVHARNRGSSIHCFGGLFGRSGAKWYACDPRVVMLTACCGSIPGYRGTSTAALRLRLKTIDPALSQWALRKKKKHSVIAGLKGLRIGSTRLRSIPSRFWCKACRSAL